MKELICLLIAYLVGSIPFAFYAVKWSKGIDLRQVGSGNLGYTNAARILGYSWAAPVLLLDIIKGIAAVMAARWLAPGQEMIAIAAGLLSILGHTWTIFLKFHGGGKGVATSAGVFAALTPASFAIALTSFILTLAATRIMSLGSIIGAVALVAAGGILISIDSSMAPSWEVFLFSIVAALLVIFRHRSNIGRLLRGEEPKLGAPKEKQI
ncbi:MAG: glycerol-3-phosphate 1-O-acyltransferase PlsY [Candidatus Omnitrophica bacterium]|nr:glycerol-3-phosphate 1-O-acyltransferase PlsY [Candidatus Omnitrophota bacterium]